MLPPICMPPRHLLTPACAVSLCSSPAAHTTLLCPSQAQAPGPGHHTCHLAVPLVAVHAILPCLLASHTALLCFLCQLTLCWCIFLFSFSFFSADFFFCSQSPHSLTLSYGCVAILSPRAYHGPTSDCNNHNDHDDSTEGRGGASCGRRAHA